MSSYYLVSLVLVLAMPIAALASLAGLVHWARDSIARAPVIGALGVVCAASALGNLLVARACGDSINRPLIGAALGDETCRRIGAASIELLLLIVVATAVVTRLGELRR